MFEFSETLADALAPITLISGVGLLLVSMSNRYGHATTRIRDLLAESEEHPDEIDEELENSIRLIFRRAVLLKNGVMTVALSAAFSSLQVLFIILEHLFNINLDLWKSMMLLVSVIFIVIGSCIYVAEVSSSTNALALRVHQHDRPE
ncbi:MAG: DUF2721 domain-containing protein [Burkholderiales bacterium]|nr:DUF2721 domain-containing protein [Burkholderiales bacterium]